jgi:hypothetical protein
MIEDSLPLAAGSFNHNAGGQAANYESMPCREHMQGFFLGIR